LKIHECTPSLCLGGQASWSRKNCGRSFIISDLLSAAAAWRGHLGRFGNTFSLALSSGLAGAGGQHLGLFGVGAAFDVIQQLCRSINTDPSLPLAMSPLILTLLERTGGL
jgi:hypothetical protein